MNKEIINTDGTISVVEMTKQEIEEFTKSLAISAKNAEPIIAYMNEFEQRAEVRQSALSKLIDLGLTEEEIAAL